MTFIEQLLPNLSCSLTTYINEEEKNLKMRPYVEVVKYRILFHLYFLYLILIQYIGGMVEFWDDSNSRKETKYTRWLFKKIALKEILIKKARSKTNQNRTIHVCSGSLVRMLWLDSTNSCREHIIDSDPSNNSFQEDSPAPINLARNNVLHVLLNIESTSDKTSNVMRSPSQLGYSVGPYHCNWYSGALSVTDC